MRLRGIGQLVQGPPGSKWQNMDLNLRGLVSIASALVTRPLRYQQRYGEDRSPFIQGSEFPRVSPLPSLTPGYDLLSPSHFKKTAGKPFTPQRVKLYGGLMGAAGLMFGEKQPRIKPVLDTTAGIVNKGESCCLFTLLLSGHSLPCWKAKSQESVASHTSGEGPTAPAPEKGSCGHLANPFTALLCPRLQ